MLCGLGCVLLLAMARAVIETWRADKLTVINKLKVNDLILLLSSTNGPLLSYMHVFRIMQSVQEKFVSGILCVLIYRCHSPYMKNQEKEIPH